MPPSFYVFLNVFSYCLLLLSMALCLSKISEASVKHEKPKANSGNRVWAVDGIGGGRGADEPHFDGCRPPKISLHKSVYKTAPRIRHPQFRTFY